MKDNQSPFKKQRRYQFKGSKTNVVLENQISDLIAQFSKRNYSSKHSNCLIRKLKDQNPLNILEGVIGIRRILSSYQRNCPQTLISQGVIPLLLKLCQTSNLLQIQFESLWCLTNISAGTSSHCQLIVQSKGVEVLMEIVKGTSNKIILQQTLWTIGNIVKDNQSYRQTFLSYQLVQILTKPSQKCFSYIDQFKVKASVCLLLYHLCWKDEQKHKGKVGKMLNYVHTFIDKFYWPQRPQLQFEKKYFIQLFQGCFWIILNNDLDITNGKGFAIVNDWLKNKYALSYDDIIQKYFPEESTAKYIVKILHANSIRTKSNLKILFRRGITLLSNCLYIKDKSTRILAGKTILNLFNDYFFQIVSTSSSKVFPFIAYAYINAQNKQEKTILSCLVLNYVLTTWDKVYFFQDLIESLFERMKDESNINIIIALQTMLQLIVCEVKGRHVSYYSFSEMEKIKTEELVRRIVDIPALLQKQTIKSLKCLIHSRNSYVSQMAACLHQLLFKLQKGSLKK